MYVSFCWLIFLIFYKEKQNLPYWGFYCWRSVSTIDTQLWKNTLENQQIWQITKYKFLYLYLVKILQNTEKYNFETKQTNSSALFKHLPNCSVRLITSLSNFKTMFDLFCLTNTPWLQKLISFAYKRRKQAFYSALIVVSFGWEFTGWK